MARGEVVNEFLDLFEGSQDCVVLSTKLRGETKTHQIVTERDRDRQRERDKDR